MKRLIYVFLCLFLVGFTFKSEPNYYYEVYLNNRDLGTIRSRDELNDYIDKMGSKYKSKYHVSKVYAPSGLSIRKITTYSNRVDSVSSIYKKIDKLSEFTVQGYEFKIVRKNKDKDIITKVNVLKKSTFNDAIDTLIRTYVGDKAYTDYLNGTQEEIKTTGKIINNVYLSENITVKKKKIPVNEKIYTSKDSLGKYLLYGDNASTRDYIVNDGDTIESVAFNNKVSPEEVLLANDNLTSTNNLLYTGEDLKISDTNPKVSVVEECYVVEDIPSSFKTVEKYDDNMLKGEEKVTQEGENGMERVSQDEKIVNGEINYVNPRGKEVLKDAVDKVIVKGSKYVPTVGSLTNWGWPTDSGWTLSSGYVYRSNPLSGSHELHTGLDIAGTGYGSKIYATNNGVVMIAEYHYSYGNYVVINHNNGYMTLYGHMSKIAVKVGQTVEKGQVIGYVGMTGSATGPHVHYEVWKGCKYCHVNPSVLYPNGY